MYNWAKLEDKILFYRSTLFYMAVFETQSWLYYPIAEKKASKTVMCQAWTLI